MRRDDIVTGQRVDSAKVTRAREMRREPTAEERLLWARLRRNALGGLHFRQQQVIDGFIADFYCHAAGLVVEVDGPIHIERQSYDEQRDAILTSRGLHILRFSNDEIRSDIPSVLARILEATRGTELPFPRREGAGGLGRT
jgi:very-short-patch-repair endonuclease